MTSCNNYVSYRVSYHTTAVCYFEVFETKRLLLFDAAMLMLLCFFLNGIELYQVDV